MHGEEKHPYRVYWVGGRRFPVYLEYYEQMEESYPAYPDFMEHPEYTDEGRPFAKSAQEAAPCSSADKPLPALRKLRLVLPGANALRPHRRLHVRRAMARIEIG